MSETMKIVAVTTSLSEDSTTLKLTDRILSTIASVGESVGIEITTETLNIRSLASALTDMTLTGFRSEAARGGVRHRSPRRTRSSPSLPCTRSLRWGCTRCSGSSSTRGR
jgi:aspartokinase